MLAWSTRLFRPRPQPPAPTDPDEERRVAERLLPRAGQVLVVPGREGRDEFLALIERLAPARRTEVLVPTDLSVETLLRLLAAGFILYDTAVTPRTGALVLDRRVGWRYPSWEPIRDAFTAACRLLWTRLGYYTVRTGTVEAVHPDNRLFTLDGRTGWVNVAYRDLPLPAPGDRLRVVGLYSFLGSTLPILHAIAIEPARD
jgi:hypothetical protein